ncbi:hypothetical protein [Streptomyces griseorubiginosus]|uniref:hypothetical protein n=1 Tax=Streptomyces griseorubiginosus TaxID=67304 RepID=UPI0013C4BBE3|nr:hypothetical protein [Streptomyces griseorubiginosus]
MRDVLVAPSVPPSTQATGLPEAVSMAWTVRSVSSQAVIARTALAVLRDDPPETV